MSNESLPIDSLMIDRWTNQWFRQLGFNDEQLKKRNEKVEQFARFVFDRIKAKKIADISKREKLLVETLREYEHRLSRTGFENDVEEYFQTMNLKQKENFLERKHQELDEKEEKFIKELDQFTENQQKLCRCLTAEELPLVPDETLIKRIERLKDYVKTLENLKNERLRTIKSYRTRLETFFNQLDLKPEENCPVKKLLDGNDESCLKTDSLRQIETCLTELKTKVDEQQIRIDSLIETLEKLYEKLNRDEKRSAAFILRENNATTVKELEDEIAQLQEKRMATSQIYCQTMRQKIEELYDFCQIGRSERHSPDFDKISPETLDDCDREFDRLNELFRLRKPILDAYEQWKSLAEQHAEFQKKSTSAARFHERGYSAVKEQAERKRFAVALPKVERSCFNALEQWEKDHPNEQFLIDDHPLRAILEQLHPISSNTTTLTKTISSSSIGTAGVPQRLLAKAQNRKKSLRLIIKQSETQHEEENEDTLEFTQLENVKHFNGLPRIVTSTPKTNPTHTVVDIGRNKTNDPIQKRRPSKRFIPTRR